MNNKFTKLVSSVLSTSILMESCMNGDFLDCPADDLNQILVNEPINSVAIPIQTQLSSSNI